MTENCHEQLDWSKFNLALWSQLSPSAMYHLRQREVGITTVLAWREMKVTSCPTEEQLVRRFHFVYKEVLNPLIKFRNEILRFEPSLGVKMAILLGRKALSTATSCGGRMTHTFLSSAGQPCDKAKSKLNIQRETKKMRIRDKGEPALPPKINPFNFSRRSSGTSQF